MANLVTDLSSDKSFFVTRQKMAQLGPGCAEAKRSPFSSPPCKASCGPWACVHDGMDGFLTSGLNHATDGRETKQCALIWDFDMCASGDIGNVVIFQCKLWHFLFLGHRENTTSHHQLLFSSNPCYFCPVSFETPEQMLSLWILLLSFKFMVQIFFFFFKSYLVFKSSFRTRELLSKINSSPSTCPVARITAITSFLAMSLTDRLLGLSLISSVLCLIFRITLLLLMSVMSNHISFYVFTIMWKIDFTCSLMFFTLTPGRQFLV